MNDGVSFRALVAVTIVSGCGTGTAMMAAARDAAVPDSAPVDSSVADAVPSVGSEAAGGSGQDADTGAIGNGTGAADADADATPEASARDATTGDPVPCGASTCSGGQVCVYVGGGPANCSPTDDAGGCGAGFSYMAACPNLANRPGCANSSPRPVSCVTLPAACRTAPTCACVPSTACPTGTTCDSVSTSTLVCGSP